MKKPKLQPKQHAPKPRQPRRLPPEQLADVTGGATDENQPGQEMGH